jgi:hypothetical protein
MDLPSWLLARGHSRAIGLIGPVDPDPAREFLLS